MDTYLFKFSACLLVFWLVYVLVLERQKMHHLKRFYLLGSVAIALLIPILTITYYVEPVLDLGTFDPYGYQAPTFIPIEILGSESTTEIQENYLPSLLWSIYGIGVLLFSIRFIVNLVKMYRRISGNDKTIQRSFIYVLLQELRIPHSFFNYVFLNKSKYETGAIPREVILHEETHAKQLHSIDILVIELLQIVFWFHPLVYILKHHIKLNHEFLADQAVLQEGVDTKTYQNILLQFSSNTDEYQLSSAINYSSIKKRFTVMKTQTSKTKIWISSLLLLPIIAILFYSFSEKEYVEKESIETSDIAQFENKTQNEGASEKLMQEYRDFIEEFNKTNTIWKDKYERAVIIYDGLMSDAQRSSVEKYPEDLLPESNLSKTKPRKPSSSQFEAFKNSKEYAVWIDGKHVSNTVLNNYSVNDFVHYSGSIVHKNARSEKFPQPNQYHLYTKAGFKATYENSQLNKYETAVNRYTNAISEYLKGPQQDNSELQILFVLAHDIYSSFSEEEIKQYNIKFPPGCPPTRNELDIIKNAPTLTIKKDGTWWINNNKTSIEAIKKDFNALIKTEKSSLNIISENPISIEEVERIHLTIGDNVTAIGFSPIQSKVYDTEENVNKYQVENYLKIYKKYEALRTSKPHYINKSEKQQKEMDALFSELGGIYFRMSKSAKTKVKRPIAPVRPYAKITLNGKTYYKKYEDLTKEEKATLPPPPPPPTKKSKGGPNPEGTQETYNPSFLEYIIEMEKEGASFYLDDEKISAKKAKSIATNNKGKRTEMKTQLDTEGKYIVKLTSAEKQKVYARSIDLKILNDGSYIIDEIKATKRTFKDVFNQLHQDITPEVRKNVMNIHVTSSQKISNKETWFIFNSLQDYGFYRIVTPDQEINRAKGNTPFAIESHFKTQEKATAKQVAEYNVWAKEHNNKDIGDRIVKLRDYNRFKAIYDSMSASQKKTAESFPKFPPLPPPHPAPKKTKTLKNKLNNSIEEINSQKKKSGPVEINGATYYYSQKNGETTYFDQYGNVVDINKIPPPPPIPNDATPEQKAKMKKATEAYMKAHPKSVGKIKLENGKAVEIAEVPIDLQGSVDINGETFYYTTSDGKTKYFNRYGKEVKMDNLPPPPPAPPAPESTLDFVIRMAKANAKFFNEGKQITSDKAIDLIKKNDKLNINAKEKDSNGISLVYITKKPILIGVKGKASKKEKGGPNVSNQQAMVDFLTEAKSKGALLTQIDSKPSEIPNYYTHLTLDKATDLIRNDSKMRIYPFNDRYSGYIVIISNNVENSIPKLTTKNRVKHFQAMTAIIGAKFYLDNKEITFKEAKRFIKRNPQAEVTSSINSQFVKIKSI